MSANKETVRQLLDGIARRDDALIRSLLDDDAQWWVPQSAARHGLVRPLVGREAVVGRSAARATSSVRARRRGR
jgi:ketosteroid isomerase-like protein